jgi:hypothetical protein
MEGDLWIRLDGDGNGGAIWKERLTIGGPPIQSCDQLPQDPRSRL